MCFAFLTRELRDENQNKSKNVFYCYVVKGNATNLDT